jgi:hypothetical protein
MQLAKPTVVKPQILIGQVIDVPARLDIKMFHLHASHLLYKNTQNGLLDNQPLME